MTEQDRMLELFEQSLRDQEKSENTIEKYMRDIRSFLRFAGDGEFGPDTVIRYKEFLAENYRVSSANSMLIAVNGYLRFIGRGECCVKTCRVQRQIFREEARELTQKEYRRLVLAAKGKKKDRLCCILQTVACTGIRIGELSYLTVEALRERKVRIDFKGKVRIIVLPKSLTVKLLDYCRRAGIERGKIFITRSGRPVDRRNIWADMKALCHLAGVQGSKVFPHNLRHLFARCFYEREKDLTRLADYLGHSSIETTRRYTMISTMEACSRELELGLLIDF